MVLHDGMGLVDELRRRARPLGASGPRGALRRLYQASDCLGHERRKAKAGGRRIGRARIQPIEHGAHVGCPQGQRRLGEALEQLVGAGSLIAGHLLDEARGEAERARGVGAARFQLVGIGAGPLTVHDQIRRVGRDGGVGHRLQAARRHGAEAEIARSTAGEARAVTHRQIEYGDQAIATQAGHPGAAGAPCGIKLRHHPAPSGPRVHLQRLELRHEKMVQVLVDVRERWGLHDPSRRFHSVRSSFAFVQKLTINNIHSRSHDKLAD